MCLIDLKDIIIAGNVFVSKYTVNIDGQVDKKCYFGTFEFLVNDLDLANLEVILISIRKPMKVLEIGVI